MAERPRGARRATKDAAENRARSAPAVLGVRALAALALSASAALSQDLGALREGVPLLEVTIAEPGTTPVTLAFGSEPAGLSGSPLSTEGRRGLVSVLGLHGAARTSSGGLLTVLAFLHVHGGQRFYLEGQILNDSIEEPAGRVRFDYSVRFLGREVASGRADLADECGVGFEAGAPRPAVRRDLAAELESRLPPASVVGRLPPEDARPASDPDPVENTHQAGSPRNGWIAPDAAKFLVTRDERYLARLADFVLAQSRRPYHLSYADGTPFQAERHPRARFIEGRPERRPGRDTLGRDRLPPEAFDTGRVNGWDHEHMNVEELYAAYVLYGSRIGRRELVLIAEQLTTTPYVAEEGRHQHSARAFGWVARALLRAYQATGRERYLEGVRRMMRSLRAHWQREGPYPALLPQPPAADHMPDERYESPFQVAVAASAVALYLRIVGEDTEALDLLTFLGDLLVERGWSPEGGGFYYDYSADSDRRTGDGTRTRGVTLWVISPLVEIAEWMPPDRREKYLVPARRLFEVNAREPWGRPSHEVYWRWLLPAARAFAAERVPGAGR